MSVRTVVVGYGSAGRIFHCTLIKLAPGLELRGVVSSDPAKRQRIPAEQGCRAYAALDEAVADRDVDLIVLATPNHLHAPLAIQAMNAGKHVVVDKPFCMSLAEYDRMAATARSRGVLLTCFQNRRLDGDFQTVRRLMADGELGDVRWIEMAWQGFGPMRGWRLNAAMGGGRYLGLGSHLVDQLCLIFPQAVESVYCRMRRDAPDGDIDTEALLVVTFAGGATGVCDFSSMAAIGKPRFYVRGTKATYVKYGLDPQEDALRSGDIDAAVELSHGELGDGRSRRTIPTLPGRWRGYYENIAAALNDGAEPLVKLAELRRPIAVLEAGLQSAASGEVIRPAIPPLSPR